MKLADKANVIVVTYDVADCHDTLTNVLVDAFSSYAAAENFIVKKISEELQNDFACGEFIKTKQNIIDLLKRQEMMSTVLNQMSQQQLA